MADDENPPYSLIKENGETTNSSREFTGKGTAIYPPEEDKSEIYEGEFVDGVKYIFKI